MVVNKKVSKLSLRRDFIRLRHSMKLLDVKEKSESIQKAFLELPEYNSSLRLALYSSFNNEVFTDTVFSKALLSGREVFFPRADKERTELAFISVSGPDELHPGLFSIDEPLHGGGGRVGRELTAGELDLIVVPGVAFDTGGARVGYGKGFYDRALYGANTRVVALAFDFQVLEEGDRLPVMEHDIGVDVIITEKRIIRIGEAG